MGVISPQMVMCITHEYGNDEARADLDKFVEANPRLFVKSQVQTNGYLNYVMFWDGSKEGWDDSDHGDELREEFINLVKRLTSATIYRVDHFENTEPKLNHQYISNWENHTLS